MPAKIRAVRSRVANVVNAPVTSQSLSSFGDLITLGAYATGVPYSYGYETYDITAAPNYNAALSCAEFRDSVMVMQPVSSSLAFPYDDLSPSFTNNTWNAGTSAAYAILPSLSGNFTHVLVWRRPTNELKSRNANIDLMDPGLYGIQYNGLVNGTSLPIMNLFADRTDQNYVPSNTALGIHPKFSLGTVLNNSINYNIVEVDPYSSSIPSNNVDFMVTVITRTTGTSALNITNYQPNNKVTIFDSTTQNTPIRPDPLFIINNPEAGTPRPGTLSGVNGLSAFLGDLGFPGLAYGSYTPYGIGFYGLSAEQYNYMSYDFPGIQVTVTPAQTGTVTLDGRPGANPITINSGAINNYGIVTSLGTVTFNLTAGLWGTTSANYTVRQYGLVFNFTVNNFTDCGNATYHNLNNGQLTMTVSTAVGGTIRYENMPGGTRTVSSGQSVTFTGLGGSWSSSNRGDYALVITHVETNSRVYCYVRCWEDAYGNSFVQYAGVNYGSGASWTRNPASISNNPRTGNPLAFTNLQPLETYQYEVYDNRTSPNYQASKSLVTITIGSQGGTSTGILPPQYQSSPYTGFGKILIESFGGIYNNCDAVWGKDIDRSGGTSNVQGVLNAWPTSAALCNGTPPGYIVLKDSEFLPSSGAADVITAPGSFWYSSTATSIGKVLPVLGMNAGSFCMVALSSGTVFENLFTDFGGTKFGRSPQRQGYGNDWPLGSWYQNGGGGYSNIWSKADVDYIASLYTLPGLKALSTNPTQSVLVDAPNNGYYINFPGMKLTQGFQLSGALPFPNSFKQNTCDFLSPSGSWIGAGWPVVDFNFFAGSGFNTLTPGQTSRRWPSYYWTNVQSALPMAWYRYNYGDNSSSIYGGAPLGRVHSFFSLDDNEASTGVPGRNKKLLETNGNLSDPLFYRNAFFYGVNRLGNRQTGTVQYQNIPLLPGKYRFKWVDNRQMKQPLMGMFGGPEATNWWDSVYCWANVRKDTALGGDIANFCLTRFGNAIGEVNVPWWTENSTDEIELLGANNPGDIPTRVYRYPAINVNIANMFNFNDSNNVQGPWPVLTYGIKPPLYLPPLSPSFAGIFPGTGFRNFPLGNVRFSLSGVFNKDGFVTYNLASTSVRLGQLFTPPETEDQANDPYRNYVCNALMSCVPGVGSLSARVFDTYDYPFSGRQLLVTLPVSAYDPFRLGYNIDIVNYAQAVFNTRLLLNLGPYVTAANQVENIACNAPLSADIREILFYNRSLSNAERSQLVHYLNRKWNLGLNLITDIGV